LPALLLGHLHKAVGLLVLGTFSLGVELAVAEYAHLGVARAAACVLAAVRRVHLDLGRLDPLAASLGRTVQSVGSGVLLKLLVPLDLELVIEESVGILQGDVL
jgi:hypothetical protein